MDFKNSKLAPSEKHNATAHDEDPEIPTKEEYHQEQITDYSGASEKTDPKEIALVRKLDM